MKNLIIAAFVMLSASFVNAQTAPVAAAPAATTTTTAAPVKVKRTYKKKVKDAMAPATTATTAPAQTAPATATTTAAPVKAKRVRKPKAEATPAAGAATTAAPAPAAAKAPMAKTNSTYVPKVIGKDAKGRDILLGPNGGQYYIGSTGKKEYLHKAQKLKVN